MRRLPLPEGRETLLYIPHNYHQERPPPLVLMLHGAGGAARAGIGPLLEFADEAGLILLAPASEERTWDLLLGGYGPDVASIDQALTHTFASYAVDTKRIAIEGFSDGASYALSLGVTNGDLFTHVIAFSPGFLRRDRAHGSLRIFISHGKEDQVLPIDATSRALVPRLKRAGYDVTYREFEGGHAVPKPIAREAVEWLIQKE